MTDLTNYGENLLLDYLMTSSTAVVRPTAWWVALHTASPTEVGNVGEVAAGVGYTRQSMTTSVSSSPGGNTANSNLISFGPASGGGFGTVTHMSICDTSSTVSYNVIWQGATTNKTVASGDKYEYAVGALTLTMA